MALPRLQLFELEDQPWFPALWRNFMTDYLCHVEDKFQLYRHALGPLGRCLDESGADRIVDLCSGSGGPLAPILRELASSGRAVPVVLADLFPNPDSARRDSSEGFAYWPSPVDATNVPAELSGLRTVFNGLHHFRPKDAQAVLADAVRAGDPIAVFEVADRTITAILPLAFVPIVAWVVTPFVRPFRWSRLLWTYLIPVIPLAILWDGVVSYLRAYTPQELLALAKAVEPERYRWEAGHQSAEKVPGRMTYLIGVPRTAE